MSIARQACERITTLGDLRRVIAAADLLSFALVDRFIRLGDTASTATARAVQDALAQIGLTLGLRQGVALPVDPPDAARDAAPATAVGLFAVCRLAAVLDDLYVAAEAAAPGALAADRAAYVAAVLPAPTVTDSAACVSRTRRKALGALTAVGAALAVTVSLIARRRRRSARPFRLAGAPFGIARIARIPGGASVRKAQLQCYLKPAGQMKRVLGIDKLPPHVEAFGDYMVDMAEKHLEPRHVAKAYLITTASIQRDAIFGATIKQAWPDAPYRDTEKVRPEDAMARILGSTSVGRRYVEAASDGRLDKTAAKTIVQWMSPWGLTDKLKKQLYVAPDLAVAAPEVERVIRTADRRTWMQFIADNAHGVGYAKAGFLGSLLGRGDLATADARELGLWREDILAENPSGTPELVEVLGQRLRGLRVQLPDRLKPYYEHLVHHAVWDAVGGSAILHEEIQRCLRSDKP